MHDRCNETIRGLRGMKGWRRVKPKRWSSVADSTWDDQYNIQKRRWIRIGRTWLEISHNAKRSWAPGTTSNQCWTRSNRSSWGDIGVGSPILIVIWFRNAVKAVWESGKSSSRISWMPHLQSKHPGLANEEPREFLLQSRTSGYFWLSFQVVPFSVVVLVLSGKPWTLVLSQVSVEKYLKSINLFSARDGFAVCS